MSQQYSEQGTFSFYDEPFCAIRIKGDLEALTRNLPFKGAMQSDKPVYIKADELLITEEALTLWRKFRELLASTKLVYLPSQLSEMVRYNSDFDDLDSSDEHLDYGDDKAIVLSTSILQAQPFFETTLFALTDNAQEQELVGFERSLIAQRRRSTLPKGVEILAGMPVTVMELAGANSNGC